MKALELSKKFTYIGAGIGLVLFAIFGLLPGSFIGGVLGLNIAGKIFGIPLNPTVGTKAIIAIMMLLGVAISGVIFILGASLAGWLIGYLIGSALEATTAGKKA
ncbi:MAG: hypothetical protein HZC12_07865 [Nitrospirae bacterium]|nr:hypothetical protein [Nitrospirota bacterium]